MENTWLENHCDGSGPHSKYFPNILPRGKNIVKKYPLGGRGNAILCHACWIKENKFNYERGKETGEPENFPQHSWYTAETYAEES
jgi:hypothetical protein